MEKILLVLAPCLGILIAWIDSRPNWDDAGVTALALFASCACWSAVSPRRPWVWALAIGLWLPLVEIARSGNYGSLMAILFAFAGAYAGLGCRKMILGLN